MGIIKENYLSIVYKGGHLSTEKCYTTLEKDCIIHSFPGTICYYCKSIKF